MKETYEYNIKDENNENFNIKCKAEYDTTNSYNTNYYFYVLNPATGRHQFSTTLAEHEGYVRKFAQAGGN